MSTGGISEKSAKHPATDHTRRETINSGPRQTTIDGNSRGPESALTRKGVSVIPIGQARPQSQADRDRATRITPVDE